MTETRGKGRERWIWVLAWVLAVLSRCLFPLADPPTDLSWSGGYYADEGFWTHDARNVVLTGAYGEDEWHDRFVSPFVYLMVRFLFGLLGPGLGAARIWPHVLSLIGLVLLALILRSYPWGRFAFLAAAVCSLLAAYQRIAILETAVVFGAVATLALWLRATAGSSVASFLTGCLAASVFITKGTQLSFLGAPVLAVFLLMRFSRRNLLKSLVLQVAGIIVTLAVWYMVIRRPHAALLRQYQAYYISQQGRGFTALLKNLLTQPFPLYFNRLPFLFMGAWAALASMASHRRKLADTPPLIVFSAVWLILGLGALSVMGYRPVRYYLPLTIPVILLSTWWFHRFPEGTAPVSRERHSWVFMLWMAIPPLVNLMFLADRMLLGGRLSGLPAGQLPGFSISGALLTVAVGVALILMHRRPGIRISSGWVRVFFIGFMVLHVARTTGWYVHRRYDVLEASEALAERLPPDAVVAGQWAPELCLETRLRAIPLWKGFVNGERPFERFGITHLLSWKYPLGDELALQRKWFPERMRHVKKICEFTIKDTPVILWRVERDGNVGN